MVDFPNSRERLQLATAQPFTTGSFFVAGVAASADAVSALHQLVSRIGPDSGMALLVFLQLPAEQESNLATVLQGQTSLTVTEVTGTARIEPNQIYIIPSSEHFVLRDGLIELKEQKGMRRQRSIDLFFRALGEAYGEKAIAILLSGTGGDGNLGLRRIREKGGLVIAQDPAEAEDPEMPRRAIDNGLADLSLSVHKMPGELGRLCAAQSLALSPEHQEVATMPRAELDELLDELLILLRRRTGHDFSQYQRAMLLGRTVHRMRVHDVRAVPAYLDFLRGHPEELDALLRDVLSRGTNFFRDPDSFEFLRQSVIPKIFAGKGVHDAVRIWSVGCATGEEVYSLAMLLMEYASRLAERPNLRIFATDIDQGAIAEARNGCYPAAIALDVPPEHLRRFFVQNGDHYQIRKELRDIVVFASHNVLLDPSFFRLDLISCRNLLAHFSQDAEERTLKVFHVSLRADGFLFLGGSESAGVAPLLFSAIDEKWRVYRRQWCSAVHSDVGGDWLAGTRERVSTTRTNVPSLSELHHAVIDQIAPSSILINEDFDILHISAHAGRFLRFAGGAPTHNLLRLVDPPLRSELHAALLAAKMRPLDRLAHNRQFRLELEGKPRLVSLSVRPVIQGPQMARGCFLVVLDDCCDPDVAALASAPPTESTTRESGLEVVRQLEDKLQGTEEQLLLTVERYETSTEELRCSNEELQAINEELHSTAEELESSREELQSVNDEYREKIEELGRANSDLLNLMGSTDIGTIFLDRTLRIKRYTPSAQKLFNITQADLQRPLGHFTHQLDYPTLAADAEQVLYEFRTIEREVHSTDGCWYLARLLPYRLVDNQVDGVVVTFIDVTNRRLAEEALRQADRNKNQFLAALSHELRNPLAAILAGVELLQPNGNSAEVIPFARGVLERQSKHLLRLVDDLLDLERLAHGKITLRKRLLPLCEVVDTAIETCRPLLVSNNLHLSIVLPPQMVLVEVDPERMTQVVINLVHNAFKYTAVGGRIELIAEVEKAEVVLRVRDNGIGIAPELLPRVFDMYSQAEAPSRAEPMGLGVGLALVRQLVELHGGSVHAQSEGSQKGSEFVVRLPILAKAVAHEPRTAQPPSGSHAEAAGRSILIVDDHTDAADALGALLESSGHQVISCYDGPSAFDVARQHRPEIAILDIGLPGMDGYELARRLRKLIPEATLIALSGWSADTNLGYARDAGFDHYLTKPVQLQQLTKLLSTWGRSRTLVPVASVERGVPIPIQIPAIK